MNRYMLPQLPAQQDIKQIYPWDADHLNNVLFQLYEHAQLTGYSGSFPVFRSTFGAFLENSTNIDISQLYDGQYETTPLARVDQILRTANKVMLEDVVVKKIPYYETSNDAGGYTVIIG